MTYLIKKASYLDIDKKNNKRCEILISGGKDGRTVSFSEKINTDDCKGVTEIFSADSMTIIPAFCDINCSLGDLSSRSDRLYNELLGAIFGGYGALCHKLNDRVFTSSPSAMREYEQKKSGFYDISLTPQIPLTRQGLTGEIAPLEEYAERGYKVFREMPDTPVLTLLDALGRIAAFDGLFISLPCDLSLSKGGVLSSAAAKKYKVSPIPDIAEEFAVEKSILLSKETSCRVHIPSVSLKSSVEAVRRAKSEGINISCSTAPQYFSYTDKEIFFRGSAAKLMPPLRSKSDIEAIAEGIADGTVDCISSDHTPMPSSLKTDDLTASEFGSAGFESAFSASVTNLVKKGVISLSDLCEKMSRRPLEILTGRNYSSGEAVQALGLLAADLSNGRIYSKESVVSGRWSSVFDGAFLYGKVCKNFNR